MTVRTWRAIAVDDEPPALKRLAALLAGVEGLELIGSYEDPQEALVAIQRDEPDLLFLDIQMPEMTGFELAAALGESPPLIIFVTAYDEFALRAFEVNSVDYLLKPVSKERFFEATERAKKRLAEAQGHASMSQLEGLLRDMGINSSANATSINRVTLRVNGKMLLVAPGTIDRAEASGNALRVYIGRDVHEFRETLTNFEARLPPNMFLRASRSTLVNIERIRHAEPWFNGDYVLVMHDGTKVTTGRTYRDRVRKALQLG